MASTKKIEIFENISCMYSNHVCIQGLALFNLLRSNSRPNEFKNIFHFYSVGEFEDDQVWVSLAGNRFWQSNWLVRCSVKISRSVNHAVGYSGLIYAMRVKNLCRLVGKNVLKAGVRATGWPQSLTSISYLLVNLYRIKQYSTVSSSIVQYQAVCLPRVKLRWIIHALVRWKILSSYMH